MDRESGSYAQGAARSTGSLGREARDLLGDVLAGSAPTLSAAEFRDLRDFVYERSGLHFAESKKFLFESRIHRRIRALGLRGVEEYRAHLESPQSGPAELLELLDAVTTHETSFFRTEAQIEVFRREVLPVVLEARTRLGLKTIHIWSAACSSGEEPYTLAMALLEVMGSEALRWRVRIVGTDLAQSVLRKAGQGIYSHYSLRNTPPYYLQKYFEPVGPDAFRLKPAARRLVEFRMLNFADEAGMRAMGGFQIIFCRNALIYFDAESKRRTVGHFARALEPGGYLFVGHSESLHGMSEELTLIQFPGAMAYQRPA